MEWIKAQKRLLPTLKSMSRAKEKGIIAKIENTKAYIRQMETYLKNGVWLSLFYGENNDIPMPNIHRFVQRTTKEEYEERTKK